ncbi:MAG: AbrB/MazE/SpoVT family DNA-binding domain-containing protein [Planctomycetes bacterium]|nr:AbrB/MazE/SpoVT family DNA-binding domain-containing protein [Planctomycetota bacterium]
MVTKLSRIGNSQGLRLPKPLIVKYHLESGIILEECEQGLLIRPAKEEKLSWAETFKQMKAEKEDWSDWDVISGDGVE